MGKEKFGIQTRVTWKANLGPFCGQVRCAHSQRIFELDKSKGFQRAGGFDWAGLTRDPLDESFFHQGETIPHGSHANDGQSFRRIRQTLKKILINPFNIF